MAATEAQKKAVAKYNAEKVDDIRLRPEKGTKDRWRAAAEAEGLTLTQFVVKVVESYLQK